LIGSKQVSPLLEIGTMGLKWRGLETGSRSTAPVLDQPNQILLFIDMCRTCVHADSMSRMIQLRNVPEGLHRTLKARAALAGMSLSEYLVAEIRRVAERPSIAELRERMERRTPLNARVSPADAVREERETR
jgi:plasmid stability protein